MGEEACTSQTVVVAEDVFLIDGLRTALKKALNRPQVNIIPALCPVKNFIIRKICMAGGVKLKKTGALTRSELGYQLKIAAIAIMVVMVVLVMVLWRYSIPTNGVLAPGLHHVLKLKFTKLNNLPRSLLPSFPNQPLI